MAEPRRRYPRVPYTVPGVIQVYRSAQVIPMVVRSLSPGGIGLTLSERSGEELARNTPVEVRFHVDGQELTLPAKIVWYGVSSDHPLDMGVRIQLPLAPANIRRSYARFVVELIQRRKN